MRKIKYTSIALLMAAGLAGCSDQFLEDKREYGTYDESLVYENYGTAEQRVNYLYQLLLPRATGSTDQGTDFLTSSGVEDDYSACTEEFGSSSIFNDPTAVLTSVGGALPDFFHVQPHLGPWNRIRECNDIIQGVTNSQSLTQEQKNELLGQAYFFRAWRYFLLVRIYGGVPIITEPQDAVVGNTQGADKIVPRSSTGDCIEFICQDLEDAYNMLPSTWDGNDYGRVTKGAALALEGRVRLMWASPLFNRANDRTRWQAAYDVNTRALAELEDAGVNGIVHGGNNARDWAHLFNTYNPKNEAVFVTLYNNRPETEGLEVHKWNNWEHSIRPGNVNGGGGMTPTSEIVDLFPMADGKPAAESSLPYDKLCFFLNRDPRFYRTFAFPGVEWQFDDKSTNWGGEGVNFFPSDRYAGGEDYELWSYCWFENEEDKASVSKGGIHGADKLTSDRGVYVRKRSDDYALAGANLFVYNTLAGNGSGFKTSANPYMEIRFAEVLLNLAESACGIGETSEAWGYLKDIRARVYPADMEDENYGLAMSGSQAETFAAILYERQIELAYEGKRFDDMRRWMLFDGGAGQEALNPSWALSGWGGNTCTYLGVTSANDQARANGSKHRIILYVTEGTGGNSNDADPLLNRDPEVERPDGLTLSEDFHYYSLEEGEYADQKVRALAEFYKANLTRKDLPTDEYENGQFSTFRPEYYFIGLRQSAQSNNSTLLQNIGWHDNITGGDGTFDPVAE